MECIAFLIDSHFKLRCFFFLLSHRLRPLLTVVGFVARRLCKCWSTASQTRKKETRFLIGQCSLLRSIYAARETSPDVTLCYYWTCGEFCVVKETVRAWHYCHTFSFTQASFFSLTRADAVMHVFDAHLFFLIFKRHREIRNTPRGRRVLPVKNFPISAAAWFLLGSK